MESKKLGILKLGAITFLLYAGFSLWIITLGGMLKSSGMTHLWPTIFAAGAISTIVSQIIFGTLADLHISPGKIIRILGFSTAVSLGFLYLGLTTKTPWVVIVASIAANLSANPIHSLLASTTLGHLKGEEQNYPMLRITGTVSWSIGCLIASIAHVDSSPKALIISIGFWLAFISIPPVETNPPISIPVKWRQWLGLDIWHLFTTPKYQILLWPCVAIAIAASPFFPITPIQLGSLGINYQAAFMSLGQVTELLACLYFSKAISRFKTRTIITWGFFLAVARFVLFATNKLPLVLIGISLQGASFAFLFLTAQVYIAQNAPKEIQSRAQSFFLIMSNGVGALLGFYFFGWWQTICTTGTTTNWHLFWLPSSILAIVATALVLTNKPAITP